MPKIAIIFIVAILFYIAGSLSQFLSIPGTFVATIWPPAGIALATVLIFGNIALVGIFLGCFIVDFHLLTSGGSIPLAIINAAVASIGVTLEAYVSKKALKFFSGTYDLFKNTRSVLVFIFISAFGACVISASLGTSTLMLTGNIPPREVPYMWFTWWIANAVGMITFTPTIMAWYQNWQEKNSFAQLSKLAITWMAILIVGYTTLFQFELIFLLIPFAIWAAFQFEIRYSTLTGILISSICLYDSQVRHNFIQNETVYISITLMQLFVSVVFLTILIIHTILLARQRAFNSLQLLNAQLEKRVLNRTKDLSETNQQLEIQKNKVIEAFDSLKQSHARLMQSEKMASLGVLTAGVAHEIKHPLNAISANMQSIKENTDQILQSFEKNLSLENIKNDVKKISENTNLLIASTNEGIKRTTDIMSDLCVFAKADEPNMVLIDLNRNIDSTLNLLNSEIKGSNIKIEKEYGKIPLLLCHLGKINQVIMNLIVNAIHALQTQRDSKIIIKTESNDNAIILGIKDNGPGIKKEILDKIFIPFFTTKKSDLGSGLGLYISNNIIKEHHGKIDVKSEIGKGTEFIITLPLKEM